MCLPKRWSKRVRRYALPYGAFRRGCARKPQTGVGASRKKMLRKAPHLRGLLSYRQTAAWRTSIKAYQKHHISFEEAKTVFFDDAAVMFDDPDHSEYEDRFLVIGTTITEKICIVSHCYRNSEGTIRIISARNATKTERQFYTDRWWGGTMREEYDIASLNPRKNPYAKKLKRQITINIDGDTIDYFKNQSEHTGIPYQTLINLYLTDCAENKRTLRMSWG